MLFEGCVAGPLQTTHDMVEVVGSALEDCDAGCDERGLHSVPTAEAESVCEWHQNSHSWKESSIVGSIEGGVSAQEGGPRSKSEVVSDGLG